MKKLKVAIGLSGGVDSAVSAALLTKAGYEVTGIYLECWRAPGCPTEQDRKDALDVALHLGIPYKVLDFKKRYHDTVVDYFYKEYQAGLTPNPDTMCNKEIKFGLFYDWAMENGFDYVATGHYAQIKTQDTRNKLQETNKSQLPNTNHKLIRGQDIKKDQSYFLYQLRQNQLDHILFPIGHLTKTKVRSLAKKFKLPVASKPDSQGICFIGPVNVKKFLSERIKPKKGKVLLKVTSNKKQVTNKIEHLSLDIGHSSQSEVIGEHDGAWYFTIGQRHGFRISQKPKAESLKLRTNDMPPLYVISKNVKDNTIVVGEKKELYSDQFSIENVDWINIGDKKQVTSHKNLSVRIRHQGELLPVKRITYIPNTKYQILLSKPAFAIAPGQAAVIYHKDQVLGGGIIRDFPDLIFNQDLV